MVFPIITSQSIRLGVVGAGTMGSGIALSALQADIPVRLYDVNAEALQRAWEYLEKHLVRKGKGNNLLHVTLTQNFTELAGCNFVIEAAPESLEIKQSLFEELSSVCPVPCVLATNTSTLAVTEIAHIVEHPEFVVGMHFFNPAPIMPLVEIVRAAQTDPKVVGTAIEIAKKMGKTPVVTGDSPGFIVNRVARPFYGEALRLLGEGVATQQEIDWIFQHGANFRMGPFRLMDLIGIDVNYTATRSMYEQSWHEPRYRPHWIQRRMVQQNSLGRKTGRGFYDYEDKDSFEEAVIPEKRVGQRGKVLVGPGSWAPGIQDVFAESGYSVGFHPGISENIIFGVVTAGRFENLRSVITQWDDTLPADIPLLCQAADITIAELATWVEHPERLVGFDGLFFAGGSAVSLVASPNLRPDIRVTIEQVFKGLGKIPVWVRDSPGLVLPRVIAMLSNEAAFAVYEGVANEATIDIAMRLGVNYPKGPLEWAGELGFGRVVAILDHLRTEFGEERFKAAYYLRRQARLEDLEPQG